MSVVNVYQVVFISNATKRHKSSKVIYYLRKLLKIMKIVSLLLCLFSVLHNTHQKGNITFPAKDAPLEKVFPEIEQQTGEVLMYAEGTVYFEIGNYTNDGQMGDALLMMYGKQPFSYKICEQLIVNIFMEGENGDCDCNSGKRSNENSIEVKGRVMNETGDPIAGQTFYRKRSTDNHVHCIERWPLFNESWKYYYLIHLSHQYYNCKEDLLLNSYLSNCFFHNLSIIITNRENKPFDHSYYSHCKNYLRNRYREKPDYYHYLCVFNYRQSNFFPIILVSSRRHKSFKELFIIVYPQSDWKKDSPIFHTA